MHFKDIDNKTAAAVLRRQQEIGMEHSARIITENLKAQEIPDELIKKTIGVCKATQQEMLPKIDSILNELEIGSANFDETTLALLEFGVAASTKMSEKLITIMLEELSNE